MLKTIYDFLKNNAKLEIFMSVVLLISVTAIACNMEKVVKEKEPQSTKEERKWNGISVVIDAGHGGKDPGKIGINGAKEKDVNLSVSFALAKVLKERGYKVVMTRTDDTALGTGERFSKVGDLNSRCKIINDTYLSNQNCVMISIHQNSFTQQSVHGAQSFYYQRSENSKRLAEIIQNKFNQEINAPKEKPVKPNDSYYMLINSKCPGVIVECGFLSNAEEAAKLTDAEYQIKLAKIIESCLNEYFNVK